MCGFGVTNVFGLGNVNLTCRQRGPDLTNVRKINGIEFLHNLLHITGTVTPQPFYKNDIAMVFNGEIYNYKDLGKYQSDGESIIDAYLNNGDKFARSLDGEFAICLIDFKNDKLIITTDSFACKPLWYEFKNDKFCVASYNSQLKGLGFENGSKLYANTTLVYRLSDLTEIRRLMNVEYSLYQQKNSYDDWIEAFRQSITKRTKNTQHGMFLGLSSGYDSGAIACELNTQNVDFKAFSINNNENVSILNERISLLKNAEIYNLQDSELQLCKRELRKNCENFSYSDRFLSYDIKKDQASYGLASICTRAKKENKRIYFSGQGADEILSDYGWNGNKIYKHSSFGGLFPRDLSTIFPWHSFYDGTQIQYLNKEEYVAGHFGIETRYPFLDKNLVQEFLWLNPNLKNKKYKNALAEYLEQNNFPFSSNEKLGFHVTAKGKNKGKVK